MSGPDEGNVRGKPRKPPGDKEQMLAWWRPGITELKPGVVNLRGIPIQDLIGKGLPQNKRAIWCSGCDGVVPLRVEGIAGDIEGHHLGIADLDALGIGCRV